MLNAPQPVVAYLDFIQTHASIGTWEVDLKLSSVFWSSETKKIHGVPLNFDPDVETGINFYKKGYSRNTIEKVFTDCIEKFEKYDVELQIITADGKEKWVRAIGNPVIENNECIKVVGLFQDIDEKTKNSKELAQKEQQFRKTFDHSLVGMVALSITYDVINVNRSLCDMLGYTKKEFLKLNIVDITYPKDKNKGDQAAIDLIEGKIDSFKIDKRYIHKNGKTIWTTFSSTIVKDKNGLPLHFIAQINDLTQIKENSNKIKKLLDTTEDQNRRLSNFAHIVSHNLRSHSSNLSMLLEITKMEMPELTRNEIFPLFEHAVALLGETVENLTEVASIKTKTEEKTISINLLESINRASGTISALIRESNTSLTVDINSEIFVKAIPAYLDSIILNVLTNAIKYKKPQDSPQIKIEASIKKNYTILKIKDSGLGIDLAKYGDKLFGMYKTFHNHADSRGIGLFITKSQIEAIGGKINVESEVNVGTTFFIHLKNHDKHLAPS